MDGKWCNTNAVELKSTHWREIQSMQCTTGVIIPPEETHAEEQQRNPHESHKRFSARLSLVHGCLSGSEGHPQETVALSGSREGQESSRSKVQIVIHRHPHSTAGQLLFNRRKLFLNSTGNIFIHSFDRFFFAKGARVRLIGIFLHFTQIPTPAHKLNCEGGNIHFSLGRHPSSDPR